MPIYAYKCESCGFAKDVLQKVSDPVLTDCPQCSKSTFAKQVTAAGFQLKGSGWYVTDFKGSTGSTSAPATAPTASEGGTASPASTSSEGAAGAKAEATTPASKPAES